ncbi:benomyl/methotrexate resistance protein [Ophiobolus disseminans]|uniref:Benomyl/methotrexate resistance protein n=1 Tax=Ophiobolus disseminans TaxID=1469910 RepID=A0A6A7A908_9PLEO|nr:benomyl/methotrexate resistance protein [Ophiobolus disseminans]
MTQQSASQTNRWSATTAAATRSPSVAGSDKDSADKRPPTDSVEEQDNATQQGNSDPEKDTPPDPQQNAMTASSQDRPTTLDWDNADDPLNPHNWSLARKWFQTYTIAGVAFVGTFASSVFTPGIELAASEFNSTRVIATFAFSVYQLGLAFGGPFAAPLSETFGRRPVIFISLPIFALFIMGTGFAPNMAALIVLRFFAGFFAAPSLSMGSGTLSDIWPPEQRSGPMSLYVATPFFGPAVGPLLGAAVSGTEGWRWTSWLILFFTVVLVIIPAPFYIESYKPVLLRRRAKKRKLPLPKSPTEGLSWPKVLSTYASKTLTRPMHMLLTEPIIAAFNAYSAFNFGLLYAFFAAFPYVFEAEYGFNSLSTGLTFLGLGVGVIVGSVCIVCFSKGYYLPHVREAVAHKDPAPDHATSRLKPEKRLPLAMIGGPCITVGLFLFGWSAAYRVHWIAPTIGEAFFGFGNMLIFMSCMMYITDTYGPLFSASAMASNAILRYILGGTFPLFAVQMFRGMGPQWACTLLGCLSVLGACIPFALVRFGPRLRRSSGYKRDG